MSKTKLELTWIGKNERKKLEPRILLEDPSKSYHASQKVSDNDIFDNKLIFGDNLLALKALEQEYAGKVKCVFIDPPYNTGSAFEHYDDGIEHSIWLTLMRDRLEIIRNLLSDDGSLWITIDDNEAHYLKVMCDEIFGRPNFIANAIWEKSDSPRMDAQFFSSRHDHLLVYAKNLDETKWNRLSSEVPKHYNKVDEQGRRYYLKPLRAMGGQGDSREARPTLYYPIVAPDGTEVWPVRQDGTDGAWRWTSSKVEAESERIEWINGKNGWSVNYRIYAEDNPTRPVETIWFNADVGSNRSSKAEVKKLTPKQKPFGTPKPEKLLERIIHIASQPGDIILDSFAGSGTTGAVAHKMGRRWLMVELGEHCHTHIIPRLHKVIDGEDQGGISKSVDWKGGGGFRYYKLAPSLIVKDKFGLEVINKEYNPEMLAEAVCKLEGFTYAPSEVDWWDHGYSTETDHIYVTTQSLSVEKLEALSEEVGSDRTLLVMCGAFRCESGRFVNLTLKKLPKAILDKCQFGQDNYSLNVANLTDEATDDIEQEQD
ncbi:site-specific DNA-methyltransferase [Vibrio cincinnatiensis]|uniref:site-specific DNA-methyltransferase n=1 Tax=Vibrio TaxID=662 RepID=UPI00237C7D8D|nr:site-specific DNA-methyltransferase [Vibrio aestuarianus]EKO3494314.1 site-specific DNA-methyltransferase [Vibrio fluvialis]MDE1338453.1 site-specific DNA-methyltransferase [Vibrio aestuarianus]